MMLKTLADHSLSKKLVAYLQLIGGHGQVALQHAIVALEPEREHVLTMNQTQAMSQKLSRKLATFKNAVMTLGQHGVHGIHVPIMGPFHLNDGDRDVNSSKYRRVHKRVNRFKLNLKRRIVKVQKITICQQIILMPRNPGGIYFTKLMEQETMLLQKLNVNLMELF